MGRLDIPEGQATPEALKAGQGEISHPVVESGRAHGQNRVERRRCLVGHIAGHPEPIAGCGFSLLQDSSDIFGTLGHEGFGRIDQAKGTRPPWR